MSLPRAVNAFRALSLSLSLSLLLLALLPGIAAADRIHTVRRGQTLARIARRYKVKVWDLAAANRMTPRKPLRAGQELLVPPRGVTYVRPGQTLTQIARAHRCSVTELRRINRLKGPLRAGARLRLPGYEPVNPKRDWGEPKAPGVVSIRRGDERRRIPLVDAERRVLHSGLVALGELMQRGENGSVRLPHPRLARLLAHLSDHFGGRELTLVSGFRATGGYTQMTSRHVDGRAADVRVAGVGRRQLWEYCRSLGHTGCGYYPRSTFVHVDARRHHAQWVDWSRPGRRPRYGTLRRPYSRRMRRNPRRPRVGRQVRHADAVPRRLEVVDDGGTVLRVADDATAPNGDLFELVNRDFRLPATWPPAPM